MNILHRGKHTTLQALIEDLVLQACKTARMNEPVEQWCFCIDATTVDKEIRVQFAFMERETVCERLVKRGMDERAKRVREARFPNHLVVLIDTDEAQLALLRRVPDAKALANVQSIGDANTPATAMN